MSKKEKPNNDDITKPKEGPKKVDDDWKKKVQMDREKLSAREKTPPVQQPKGVQSAPPVQPAQQTPPPEEQPQEEKKESREEPGMSEQNVSEVNFINFISGLAAQVMISLGQEVHPMTGQRELNLEQASYTIDILSMLKEKSKGNLTQKEDKFLSNILYQLQMVYTQISKQLEEHLKKQQGGNKS